MDNNIFTIEELKLVLSNYQKDDGEALFSIIKKVFEGNKQSRFHTIYTEEYSNIQNKSHLHKYVLFKLSLLYKFFESVDRTSPSYKSFFIEEIERPFNIIKEESLIFSENENIEQIILEDPGISVLKANRLSIILDHILQHILYRIDDLYISILDTINKYNDIIADEEFNRIVNIAYNACIISTRLNKNQIDILKKYDTINPCKWIQILINKDDQILFHVDLDYKSYMRNLNDDTVLQMYLFGSPSTSPISYKHSMKRDTDKVESQKAYDEFVRWLWKFGQSKKPDHRTVPRRVKLFCIELLNIVAEASPGAKYTKGRDFPLNRPDTAWRNFGTFNTNIKTHKYRKKPTD